MISLFELTINDCINDGILEFQFVDEARRIKIFLAYIMQLNDNELADTFTNPASLNLFRMCASQIYYCVSSSVEQIVNDYLRNMITEFSTQHGEKIKYIYSEHVENRNRK